MAERRIEAADLEERHVELFACERRGEGIRGKGLVRQRLPLLAKRWKDASRSAAALASGSGGRQAACAALSWRRQVPAHHRRAGAAAGQAALPGGNRLEKKKTG